MQRHPPDHAQPAAATAETAALEYWTQVEKGRRPNRRMLASRLSHAERRKFDELLDAVAWLRDRLPGLRPQRVLAGRYELRAELPADGAGVGRLWSAFDRVGHARVTVRVLTEPSLRWLARNPSCGGRVLDVGRDDDVFYVVHECRVTMARVI